MKEKGVKKKQQQTTSKQANNALRDVARSSPNPCALNN